MNRYITDEFYNDPKLQARLFAMARAERNRAIHAGIDWLKGRAHAAKERARALFSLCIGPLRGTERLI